MRVLMTADTAGGVWTYALELVSGLARRGVEVLLAVMGEPRDAGDCRAARVEQRRYALEWMDDPWEDVERAGAWLLELAEEFRPDLVHVNGYAHASLPWRTPVLVVGHSDVLSWHDAVRGAPAGPEWDAYRLSVGAGLAAADLLVAPTQALLDELVRLYRPACARTVIPNGIGRTFPLRHKEALVVAAGRVWDEAKNIAALARVADRLPWPVVVAGEGATGPGIRALGQVGRAEMDELLASAAVFAEPARYEPFGLAALEAARAHCALVLGAIPSLREVWGDAAVYVDPGDDRRLELALRLLIDDEELRDEYADRAHRRSLELTTERMAAAYAASYARLRERQPA